MTRAARRGPDILEERCRAGLRDPAVHAHAYLLLLVVATSAVRGPCEYHSIDFTLFPIVSSSFSPRLRPRFNDVLRRVAYHLRPDPLLPANPHICRIGPLPKVTRRDRCASRGTEMGLPFGSNRSETLMNGTDTIL